MSDVYEGIEWDVSKWWFTINQKKNIIWAQFENTPIY